MESTSTVGGSQVQPAPSSLVNDGISGKTVEASVGTIGESWDPDSFQTEEKRDYLVKVVVFRNEAVAVFEGTPRTPPGGEKRGLVAGASRESLNRLFLRANNTPIHFKSMSTTTIHNDLWQLLEPRKVKEVHHQFIKLAQRRGLGQDYIWVREHQKNGSPHFHNLHPEQVQSTFTAFDGAWGEVAIDFDLSREFSIWWTVRIGKLLKHVCCHAGDEFRKHSESGCPICRALRKMAFPQTNQAGFLGCVRFERLRAVDNVGGYFSKELSKRFQKEPPELWQNAGRYWGHSKNVVPKPLGMFLVPVSKLHTFDMEWDGREVKIVQKLQYGMGKSLLAESAVLEPLDESCRKSLENMGIEVDE